MVDGGGDGSGRHDARQSKHVELLYEDAGDAGVCVGGHLLGCWCRLCSGSTAVSRAGVARRGVLALPAVWVTSEYVRNVTSPHGSAGSLAYSQLRFLPFLQLASITGPWGMS